MENKKTPLERMNHSYNKIFEELDSIGLGKKYLRKHFKPLLDECIKSNVDFMKIKTEQEKKLFLYDLLKENDILPVIERELQGETKWIKN